MTDKSQQILNRMREKDRTTRALDRLSDPKYRDRLLDSFNRSMLDDGAAPIGDGQMTILKDLENLRTERLVT